MNTRRASFLITAVVVASGAWGCATVPSRPPGPAAPTVQQKQAWILQLEDQRVLRAPATSLEGVAAVGVAPPQPDLLPLVTDPEAQVRRRAALAIGRVGDPEGIAPLARLLASEPDPEVRQMAAFAIGLIGDASGAEPLIAALGDADPLVQGRAAEALGALGHAAAADAVAAMMAKHVAAGVLDGLVADDSGFPKSAAVEAVRLGLNALVRLDAYDQLAATMLDQAGRPVSRWWPVAFAFQRVGDARAAGALTVLLEGDGQVSRGFAARGLGGLKHAAAAPALLTIAANNREPDAVRIQALRALAAIADPTTVDVCATLLTTPSLPANLRLEALTALAAFGSADRIDLFLDVMSDRWPALRAAALGALATADPPTFLSAISGLDPDPHWSVRAALATALGGLDQEQALPRLTVMLGDDDQRVLPAVLDALVKIRAPSAPATLLDQLQADDPVVRRAAANGLAALRPPGAVAALIEAFERAQRDGTYVARAGILTALVSLDAAAARPLVERALEDKDWAVRVRAVELLATIDPAAVTPAIGPAPQTPVTALADLDTMVSPAVSPVAYIETEKGVIQVALAVLDAPRTVANFIALVERNFFAGMAIHRVVPDFVVQAGDPRGDGDGGPGYTIRDEINQRPFLRGAVGMALDWADTGGSQFFITLSPQPHLDGTYTVFGDVVSGMEVVDQLRQWDQIRSIRVWDGVRWIGPQ